MSTALFLVHLIHFIQKKYRFVCLFWFLLRNYVLNLVWYFHLVNEFRTKQFALFRSSTFHTSSRPDPTHFMYVHKYLDILSTTCMRKTLRSLNIPQHIYFVQPSLHTHISANGSALKLCIFISFICWSNSNYLQRIIIY